MATYLMDLVDEVWLEQDVPFAPEDIWPILRLIGMPDPENYYVASYVKGTTPIWGGTLTGQIDIMTLQSKVSDTHIICARDTLQ